MSEFERDAYWESVDYMTEPASYNPYILDFTEWKAAFTIYEDEFDAHVDADMGEDKDEDADEDDEQDLEEACYHSNRNESSHGYNTVLL
jgi:hypothetical protein